MKTIIILGDGDPKTSDQNLQAIEFWNAGLAIAKWCGDGLCDASIYAPQRVYDRVQKRQPDRGQQEEEAVSPDSHQINPFNSARAVVNALQSVHELPLIVCIGHGFDIIGGGAVELCGGNNPADRQLSSGDINSLTKAVYLGLHCHAESFANGVNNGKPVFHLTGTSVGQNSDIGVFVDNCKISFGNLVGHLVIYDGENDKDSSREAISELKKMAKTVNDNNSNKAAGQKNTFS